MNPNSWTPVFVVSGILLVLGVIGGPAAKFALWAGILLIAVFILSFFGSKGFP